MALAASCAVLSLDALATEVWKATGHTRYLPRMQSLALVLTTVLVAAAVPIGLVAVCGAVSLASVGIAIYAVWGIHDAIGLRIRTLASQIWPPAVSAVLMASALYAIDRLIVHAGAHGVGVALALLAFETLLGAALYVCILRLVAPEATAELSGLARPLVARVQLKLPRGPFTSEYSG
jgi:hypothetical protein